MGGMGGGRGGREGGEGGRREGREGVSQHSLLSRLSWEVESVYCNVFTQCL